MEYPIQFYGYLNEQDVEPTCMVSNVTKDTVRELNQLYGLKVNEWFLSSGRCGKTEVHGPYKKPEEAFEQARAKYGVAEFKSPLLCF